MKVNVKRNNLIKNGLLCLFFALIIGLVLYGREFAHLNFKVFILPIYVTELFLMVSIIIIIFNSFLTKEKKLFVGSYQKIEFFLFYIIFLISLIRGLLCYPNILFTLRQSAIIYYSLFYFIVPIILDNFNKIKIYFFVLAFCSSLLILMRLFKVDLYGLGSFSYYYLSLSFIFLLFYSFSIKKKLIKICIYLLASTHLIFILLSRVRAAWIGLFIAMLFASFVFFKVIAIRRNLKQILLMGLIGFLIIALVLSIFLLFFPSTIKDIKEEFVSIYRFKELKTIPQRNAMWRLIVWKDITDKILKSPIIGYGFGAPFQSETIERMGWDNGAGVEDIDFIDPHNSYLSILYRTGFVGLTIFLFIIIRFFRRSINFLENCHNKQIKIYITSVLTIIVFILGTSFFMVVLEGPFLGIFLWINMGLVVSIMNIVEKSKIIN